MVGRSVSLVVDRAGERKLFSSTPIRRGILRSDWPFVTMFLGIGWITCGFAFWIAWQRPTDAGALACVGGPDRPRYGKHGLRGPWGRDSLAGHAARIATDRYRRNSDSAICRAPVASVHHAIPAPGVGALGSIAVLAGASDLSICGLLRLLRRFTA